MALRLCLFAIVVTCFAIPRSNADVLISEDFSYSDGALTVVSGGLWTTHSGTAGQIQVAGGQITLADSQSEDVNRLTGTTLTSGAIYGAFDFSVFATPSGGTDYEYFAHFGNGTSDFTARMDIQAPQFGGDYTVGISPSSTAEANWGSDLVFNTTYKAVIGYNRDSGLANLWINPVDFGSTSIQSTTSDTNDVTAFYFRESASNMNETITIDNLRVATTFNEAIGIPEPSAVTVLCLICLLTTRRRR